MAPRTVPGIFVGYYEGVRGLTQDYMVIPLSDLGDAKHDPNDLSNWRATPTRTGRVIFDKLNPQFPMKSAYDVSRESILRRDSAAGHLEAPPGTRVPLFQQEAGDPTVPEPGDVLDAPEGDIGSQPPTPGAHPDQQPPLPPPAAPPGIRNRLKFQDGRVVWVEEEDNGDAGVAPAPVGPPRGDSSSAPPAPDSTSTDGGPPPASIWSRFRARSSYAPEVLERYPDNMEFDANDPEVYGEHFPVRRESMRVPDISVEDWAKLSDGDKHMESRNLYQLRVRERKKAKIKRLRDSMQRAYPIPSPSAAVSSISGFRVQLPTLTSDEVAFVTDSIHSTDSVEPDEGTHEDSKLSSGMRSPWLELNAKDVPSMPIQVVPAVQAHRDHVPDFSYPFNLLVAEPVSKTQRAKIPKAQEACDAEWLKLLKRDTWDPYSVKEWNFVATQARDSGKKVHVARLFEICVVKGAELDDSDSRKKYKGRAVLDGSWVKDENYDVALFNEMGSSPANMQAGKAVDAYGLQRGYDTEQADAEAAYTQCELQGTPTWVRLPEDRWPKEWFYTDSNGNRKCKYTDPVCRLKKALYGHPDAGTYWEQHAEKHLKSVGFLPVTDWRSCFVHPGLKLYLIVYVDDFKMAGPTQNLPEGWKLIRKGIETGDPEPVNRYLGCEHIVLDATIPVGSNPPHGSVPKPPPKAKPGPKEE